MDIGNIMKTQMFTIGAMKEDSNIVGLIQGFIMMTIIEHFLGIMPKLVEFFQKIAKEYYENKKKDYLPSIVLKDDLKSCIIFDRDYEEGVDQNEMVDALIDYVCKQDSVKKLLFSERFIIHNHKTFIVTKEIEGKVIETLYDDRNKVKKIKFEIFSKSLKLSDLRKWLNNLLRLYQIQKKNNLGDRKYFFNEMPANVQPDMDGGYRLEMAPKFLSFTMSEFSTNKKLSNVFGKQIDRIRERVQLFIDNPEWYSKRGIPYTLGLLLHGPPGTGKTSMIKAIAKDTDRHIINLSLRKTTTQTQLRNLFFNENINVVENGNATSINIPLEQRVYVIEDIDCLTDVVLDRKYREENEEKKEEVNYDVPEHILNPPKKVLEERMLGFSTSKDTGALDSMFGPLIKKEKPLANPNGSNNKGPKVVNSEELNLSFLLNLLDGVLEIPGRILIMTSNYPEKLDKALIRPGRVDLFVEFGLCDVYMMKEMFNHFYENFEIEDETLEEFDKVFTPAELTSILCTHYTNAENAIKSLRVKMSEKSNKSSEDFVI